MKCGKWTFKTLDKARKVCAKFWLREGVRQWPYRCPKCGFWHTTSKNPEEQMAKGFSVALK
jgi:hypothetical protein